MIDLISRLREILAGLVGNETSGSYNLPNDVAENTAITFTTTKRTRLDSVWLDFSNLVQDVTLKVYHNAIQYDHYSWATTEEDGVLLNDILINNDWSLTITSTVAQGAIVAIPYVVLYSPKEE